MTTDPIRIGMLVRGPDGEELGRVTALGEAGIDIEEGELSRPLDAIARVEDGEVWLKPADDLSTPDEFEQARATHDAFVSDAPARQDPEDYSGDLHLSPGDLTDARKTHR